jgi:3-deoxy-D-manno-octulosonic-acid transferase
MLLSPLLLLKLLSKKADTKALIWHQNRQRFGFYPKHYQPKGFIIHCVSMGEVNAAEGIVRTLLTSHPNCPITLTCTSVTGAQQAIRLYGDSVQHAFLPIDFPLFTCLMLKRLRPRALIITEVEVWSNLIHQCYKRKVATILINARMTTRSLANYQKFAFLFRPTLRKFNAICAQGEQDFENFISIGVFKDQLYLTNNLKFDLKRHQEDSAKAEDFVTSFNLSNRPIIVGASTHEGEEKALLNSFKQLQELNNELVLILVPRYPHRFEEVALLVSAMGFTSSTLSAPKYQQNNNVIVVDQMGLLKAMYSIASLCFVGGSFVEKGGHNPLEAALYGVPICMGPSIFNNPAIVSALQNTQALRIVNDEASMHLTFYEWLSDLDEGKLLGERGYKVIESNAGATQKTLGVIEKCVVNA